MKTPVQLEPFSQQGHRRLLARAHPIELVRGLGFAGWGLALGTVAGFTAFTEQTSTTMSALITLFCLGAAALAVDAISTGIRHLVLYRYSVLMITDHHIATVSGAAGIVRAYPRCACHVHPVRYSWLGNQLNYGLIWIDNPDGHHLIGLPIRDPDQALIAATCGHPDTAAVSS